jgi:hypothetical protein
MEIASPHEPFLLNWDTLREVAHTEAENEKDKQIRPPVILSHLLILLSPNE